MPVIRKAEARDEEAVYRLICFLEDEAFNRSAFGTIYQANLTRPDIEYVVAECEGVVCAFASLHVQWLLHHAAPVGEIQELIVGMDYRGQGIGGKLFDRLSRIAAERSCAQLEVASKLERKRAHDFYQRRGLRYTHLMLTKVLTPPKPIRRSFTYESHDAEG